MQEIIVYRNPIEASFYQNIDVFAVFVVAAICSIYCVMRSIELIGFHRNNDVSNAGLIVGAMCGIGATVGYLHGTELAWIPFVSPIILLAVTKLWRHIKK
jgi:hypothetical protein